MKNPFRAVRIFGGETAKELQKASWPTRSELKESTIVVIIGVMILGVFVSLVDFSLFQVVNLFTGFVIPS
jgi:preprotein translocase subunit SecE